ncbi:MAG: PepSY-like domain-containing protein [Muribaculaceae bacterium]|nr:PepSY-like domain-containing protein [Muribaculaceae bacterium]
MKKIIHLFCIALLSIVGTGCHDTDVWDDVPAKIATFLNQYYPNSQLSSCERTGSDWHVRISDGPALTFDASYNWTVIAGYGETLPQVLLFDQLPPALYDYLEETGSTTGVYSLERDKQCYTVGLSNTSVVYDISTGRIHSPVPPA